MTTYVCKVTYIKGRLNWTFTGEHDVRSQGWHYYNILMCILKGEIYSLALNLIISKTKTLKTKFNVDKSLIISTFTYANRTEIKVIFWSHITSIM